MYIFFNIKSHLNNRITGKVVRYSHITETNAISVTLILCQKTDQYFSLQGKYCTQDVDECVIQPRICQNGGTCMNEEGGYQCICVNGWEGKECTINKDDCKPMKCRNGGTCVDRVGYYTCTCPPGKTGRKYHCFTIVHFNG